jgi:hypothetical protein
MSVFHDFWVITIQGASNRTRFVAVVAVVAVEKTPVINANSSEISNFAP